jgi:hypothetical protein
MILSFYAHARKGDIEIIITQENIFVNNETEKSENKRKERENSEKSRSFFIKCSPKIKHLRGHFLLFQFQTDVPSSQVQFPPPRSTEGVSQSKIFPEEVITSSLAKVTISATGVV